MRRALLSVRTLLFALLCALAVPSARAAASVGFRVLERTDASRVSPQFPKGRPLQLSLWYPTAVTASPPLTYRDYYLLSVRELSFEPASEAADREALARFTSFLGSAGVKPEEAESLLATKMRASRDAAPAPGRFPLILIAQGNEQSAHDQAFLAELLAAHGYVVATLPSQARIGGPMKSEEDIPSQAEEQAADLAFAVRTLRAEPQVRPGKYGLVAHSFGARSALLLAMGDREVAALVSLDGGIGGRSGKGWLEKARGFDRRKATAPLLHLYEEGDRFMVPDLDLLRSLVHAPRWLVKVDGMRHVHFSSLGIAVRSLPALAERTSAEERTAPAWDAVAATTASFLDRFVGKPPAVKDSPARWTAPASPLLHVEGLPVTGR